MERGRDEKGNRDGRRLKPAPGSLALVQGFVNTRNIMRGYDLLDEVEGAAGWLVERGLLAGNVGLTEEGRLRLLEFREGLRRILLGHNGGPVEEGVDVLNEAAEDALLRVRFDGGGAPGLLPAGAGAAVGGGAARLLVAAVGGSSQGTWQRVKAFRQEGGLWAF